MMFDTMMHDNRCIIYLYYLWWCVNLLYLNPTVNSWNQSFTPFEIHDWAARMADPKHKFTARFCFGVVIYVRYIFGTCKLKIRVHKKDAVKHGLLLHLYSVKPLLSRVPLKVSLEYSRITTTRWWFQIFFIFIPTWGNDPIWLTFFKWVETTN